MKQQILERLKRAAWFFNINYMALVYDFNEMRKHDKTSTDDELVDGIIEGLSEGMAS